jgi:hypothetical protein
MLEAAQWGFYDTEEFRWIGQFGHSGGKMRHREPDPEDDTEDLLVAIAMFHGIYKRVAGKVGVGQTMVGRVVRGSRTSKEISEALHSELRAIRDYLNGIKPRKLNGG